MYVPRLKGEYEIFCRIGNKLSSKYKDLGSLRYYSNHNSRRARSSLKQALVMSSAHNNPVR